MNGEPLEPWIARAAQRWDDRAAILAADTVVSWAALADEAEGLAGTLARLGVSRGDVVAVRMRPCPRFVALLHAMQMLGAAILPLNLRLAAAESDRLLAHIRPALLLDEFDDRTSAAPRCLHPFDDLRCSVARRSFVAARRVDPDAAWTIVQTSGTTALPKAVPLSSSNHAASATASRQRLGHDERDTWLATLPLYHVGGLAILARSVLEGSSVRLETAFDTERLLAVLAGGDATMISVVPTMLARALEHGPARVSPRLRCLLVGGASLSPSLARRALDAALPVSVTWGMTESCSQICTTPPGSELAAAGSVGRPLDGFELAIPQTDADGWGSIRVRGPAVTSGYLANPDANDTALRDGWLVTGDVGRIDEHGALTVAGRGDDMLVSGGENIAPLEVERVLDAHDDVLESLVFGVSDEVWGERVVALVVPARERTPDPESLRNWCRGRIASYKIPREFRVADELPRGPTGKLLRRGVAPAGGRSGH